MRPIDYAAIPYIISIESIHNAQGLPACRAEYPELESCIVEAPTALEALEKLDALKSKIIAERLGNGTAIPVPRAPLKDLQKEALLF